MPSATLDWIDPPVVAALLRRAADEFMHHGCNDFDLAAVLPDVSDRRELMRQVNEWNNSPGDFDPEGSYRIVTDWVLMRFLATKTLAVIKAVKRENCRRMLCSAHGERVRHFEGRITAVGRSPQEWVIVVINVDDLIGGPIAEALMPGHDWAPIRASGLAPYARGLAQRAGMQDLLDVLDHDEANKLRAIDVVAVVMVDRGAVYVFAISEVLS